MDGALFLIQCLNALQLGLTLFLISAGLTLIFGILGFVNLAHGAFYMLGAFIAASLTHATGYFALAVILTFGLMIGATFVLERTLIRRWYAKDHLTQVLATFGLILLFDGATQWVWGTGGMTVPQVLDISIPLNDTLAFPAYRLLMIGVAAVLALGLYALIHRTQFGVHIRAAASNAPMARNLGLNTHRLFARLFALGTALAALAGALMLPISGANIGMGANIIMSAFVVIIVGGVGSVKGAFYAALLVGVIDTLGRAYLDSLLALILPIEAAEAIATNTASMLIYLVMAVVLMVRPAGLFPPPYRAH